LQEIKIETLDRKKMTNKKCYVHDELHEIFEYTRENRMVSIC